MNKGKSRSSVLVIPFPAQGHVNCLINFSYKLAQNGFNVIFVNTDFNHKRMLMSSSSTTTQHEGVIVVNGSQIRFVSIPDGLEPDDERNDLDKFCRSVISTMPVMLEKLIGDLSSEGDDITCVVADVSAAWAVEVANKLGIKSAAVYSAAAAMFALKLNIPKLIQDGIIDNCYGHLIGKRTFQLSPSMPTMKKEHILWNVNDLVSQKSLLDYMKQSVPCLDFTEWWFCNTIYELEAGTLSFIPKILPIGPLVDSHNHKERSIGRFFKEDMSCLDWLNQHPPCSVIYIAFGSISALDSKQFQEIALGLELTNRPFLWVVRPGFIKGSEKEAYPHELKGGKGKIVGWAPQWDVLSHPSIACFISHCGWNSTLEGLCNGVPFLCWPFFGDQFFNKTSICDEWKVGLGFESDENGFVSSGEIRKKVEDLVGDGFIRAVSLKLKELMMNNLSHGGRSSEIFNKFFNWLKE